MQSSIMITKKNVKDVDYTELYSYHLYINRLDISR